MEVPPPPAASLNPNNFPAKLWWLVNSPRIRSVRWDALGEGLLIEQPLFEAEVLGRWGGDVALGELFKSSKFSSFIRQLNLYGFRKLQTSMEHLHHYYSPHFRRDRPELLERLKRLTRANKAKAAAAGLGLGSRLPNHSRLPTPPPGRANGTGLLAVGQFCEPYQQHSFLPYSYISASAQNCSTLPSNSFEQNPVPSRAQQNSLLLLPEHNASSAFPDMGIAFPTLQGLPTEGPYTLQPNFSPVPLQQVSQAIAASSAMYSSCMPPLHYSQAYYPTATLPCCSLATHTSPLTCNVSPTAPNYAPCSFYQGPPMQTPYVAESLPSNQSYHTSDESQMTEIDLETVFQHANEMSSLPKPVITRVEPVEEELTSLQSNGDQPLLDDPRNDHQPSDEERQLEPHTTIVSDIVPLAVVGEACSLSQPSEYIYTFATTEAVECAAAQTVREPVAMQETQAKLREEQDQLPPQSSAVFVQEVQPFSPQKVDTTVRCEFLRSESEEVGCLTAGAGPVEEYFENTVSSVQANNGEGGNSPQGRDFHDFYLLVDFTCMQEPIPQGETRE